MNPSVYRRNTCRLCDGSQLELVMQLASSPPADDYVPPGRLDEVQACYPLDVFFCHSCGHLQLLDVLDPEALFCDYLYTTASSPGLVAYFRDYAEGVMHLIDPPEGATVVDIGSNDGTLLRFFQERGMQVLGVDPAADIAYQATEAGIETLPYFFTPDLAQQIRNERGPSALVTANNVFAHADDLAGLADGIHDLLAPDGVFIFEVSYLVDLMQNMVFDWIYHEHLCYHAVKPLETFLQRHGMELIRVERTLSKGGTIRCTAQLDGGPRTISPSVAELIGLEARLGLDGIESFKVFAARIEAVKSQFLDLLRGFIAQGKAVSGYGASATVTTLVYHFELGDKLSFMVDDNPDRQGLFSPGHHIPVLPPQAIYDRKPDYVVVLAWRFAKPIIEKHQAFLGGGGHFVTPLPDVTVV